MTPVKSKGVAGKFKKIQQSKQSSIKPAIPVKQASKLLKKPKEKKVFALVPRVLRSSEVSIKDLMPEVVLPRITKKVKK